MKPWYLHVLPCITKIIIQKYQDTAARDPSQYHESHESHEYHPGAPNISPKVRTCRLHGLQGSQQWWCYPCAWWLVVEPRPVRNPMEIIENLWCFRFPFLQNPTKNTHVNNKQTIECMMGFFLTNLHGGSRHVTPWSQLCKISSVVSSPTNLHSSGINKNTWAMYFEHHLHTTQPLSLPKVCIYNLPWNYKSLLNDLWKTILSFWGPGLPIFRGYLEVINNHGL